jgi:hypothetical protein
LTEFYEVRTQGDLEYLESPGPTTRSIPYSDLLPSGYYLDCLNLMELPRQDPHGLVIILGPDILLAPIGSSSPLLELFRVGVVS